MQHHGRGAAGPRKRAGCFAATADSRLGAQGRGEPAKEPELHRKFHLLTALGHILDVTGLTLEHNRRAFGTRLEGHIHDGEIGRTRMGGHEQQPSGEGKARERNMSFSWGAGVDFDRALAGDRSNLCAEMPRSGFVQLEAP